MKKYFIVENDQQAGPFSKEELKAKGIIQSTLVWFEGMANWEQASTVPELADLFIAPPPPPSFQSPPPPPNRQVYSTPVDNKSGYIHPGTNNYKPSPDAGNTGGGLVALGYLLALIGGLGGIIIGSILWMGKVQVNGEKIKKYTPTGQLHGAFAFFLGIIVWATCVEMFLK